MAAEELPKPSKYIKVNPETKRRLLSLEADIPKLEEQVNALSEIMDVTSLKEKIAWGKKAAKILREHFVDEK